MRTILLVSMLGLGMLGGACDNTNAGTDPDAPTGPCEDLDQDGVTTCDGDCDDTSALTAPGADELCGDGTDNDCNGEIDEDCLAGVGTFVSTMTGDDANPGTAAAPVKTIAKGIANAMLLGGERSVIVAEGSYAEKVTLSPGIDLLGGHQCNVQQCAWTRDLVLYPSTIANTDFEGVLAGPGVTQATLLSGFTITGLGGAPATAAGSVGVTLNGGSPTLRGNKITAGAVGAANDGTQRSIGVAVRSTTDAAGAVIENNEITAGMGSTSIGIAVESPGPAMTSLVAISANVVRSGTARRSIAILALRAAPGSIISNNDVTAGSSAGGASTGIQVGSPVIVDRNRIDLDRATTGACTQTSTWCAAIAVEGATTQITNNIAIAPRGQRTAGLVLAELEQPAGTVTVANNYFDGGGSGPNASGGSRNESAAIALVISGCTTCNLTGIAGRIGNNILVGGNNADRYGVREDAAANHTIHPVFVNANLFYFAPANNRIDFIYREIGATGIPINYGSVFLFEANGPTPAAKNTEDDPLLDGNWHLEDSSPCIDQGTATDAPAKDFEGDLRPAGAGIDIGHDEH